MSSFGDHLIFKGGTSLSKAYDVIHRFSEDVDLSLDRTQLGFEGDRDPENPLLIVVAALTTGNLPELTSQVCTLSTLFDLNLVVHNYNGAMQV